MVTPYGNKIMVTIGSCNDLSPDRCQAKVYMYQYVVNWTLREHTFGNQNQNTNKYLLPILNMSAIDTLIVVA